MATNKVFTVGDRVSDARGEAGVVIAVIERREFRDWNTEHRFKGLERGVVIEGPGGEARHFRDAAISLRRNR